MSKTITRKHLTIADLCEELGIARSTFYDWRAKGRAPRCIKLPNGDLRIRRTEFERWLAEREEVALSGDITYDVRVYKTYIYKGKRGNTYRVRWKVGNQAWARTFDKSAQADSFRSELHVRRPQRGSVQTCDRRACVMGTREAGEHHVVRLRLHVCRHEVEGRLCEVPTRHRPSAGRRNATDDYR